MSEHIEEKEGEQKFTESERNELIEKIANLEQDKANTVEELIEVRKKKQEAEEEAKNKEVVKEPEGTDPIKLVEDVLSKRDAASALAQRNEAISEFKLANPEFNPDSDTAGIAFSKFEREMKKFDLSSIKSKDEMTKRLKEVYEFMNRGAVKQTDSANYHKGSNPTGGSDPKDSHDGNLTDKEARLMTELGFTKERYLAIKAKRPAYVESLLRYRN